mmetsp:Transcript_61310/g.168244  ORF Transcript_61310/g.168244 Transcript_61310/m.168244 type:complete len:320 (-) Transcript_61310:76-1035(-)
MEHPIFGMDSPIFFLADMPHLIKKIRNQLETSSGRSAARDCQFPTVDAADGRVHADSGRMNLRMLEHAWIASGGDSSTGSSSLCVSTKLTRAHFHPTSWSRMRVPLAVQVLSTSMIRFIDNLENDDMQLDADAATSLRKQDLGALRALCENVDRMVDICNGRSEKGVHHICTTAGEIDVEEQERNVYERSSWDHEHLRELLQILGWFQSWKVSLAPNMAASEHMTPKERKAAFLPDQTWMDVQQLILGAVCGCQFYLRRYPDKVVTLRRLNQDICEHHFAHVREAAGSTDSVSAGSAMRATVAGAMVRANRHSKGNCQA